jgi:hypothetical protein
MRRILSFDYLERRRPKRTGPPFPLSDAKVDEIINYCSESWDDRILKFDLNAQNLGSIALLKSLSEGSSKETIFVVRRAKNLTSRKLKLLCDTFG